jgi:hypothetical protein
MKGHLRVLILAVRIKMNGSDLNRSADAVATWPSATAAPSPVRSSFLGHGARLSVGISSKWRGTRWGSHLG